MARFGRFRLDALRRELFADGVPVAIGSRAFDVLLVLVEAHGELVTKDELLRRVWSGTIVEENTLQFQISTLRKALGPDRGFIRTIAGRGYRFVAEVIAPDGEDETSSDPAASIGRRRDLGHDLPPPTNLPAPMSDLVGREARL